MTEATDELAVFEGVRPTRTGDLALESQGMAPIPEEHRYGGVHRMFTVWFTPNMELSGVFTGTLAVVLGLGFGLGLVAIIVGTIIGALPVAILCTWGPKTGTAQVPLARLPFGRTIVLPGTVQWLSSIAWDALVGLFGGEAAQLLFHVPFWIGGRTRRSLRRAVTHADGWTPFALAPDQLRSMLASVELPEAFDVVLGPPAPFDPLGDADGTRRGLDELAALGTTVVNLTVRHDSLAHYLEQLEAFVALGGLDHPDVPPTSRTRGAVPSGSGARSDARGSSRWRRRRGW